MSTDSELPEVIAGTHAEILLIASKACQAFGDKYRHLHVEGKGIDLSAIPVDDLYEVAVHALAAEYVVNAIKSTILAEVHQRGYVPLIHELGRKPT